MIKDLPVLSSDYALWDWEAGIGTATTEEVLAGYNALLNQGACSDFSRLIWNDIVDLLNNALVEGGIGWSETYCTAEECKIDEQLGAFTAKAFNSVRHNIDRFRLSQWRWVTVPQKKGYTGRAEFRGVEEYGKKADQVYGWYIIELTKRMNTLLEVLRGTADLAEGESDVFIEGKVDAVGVRIKTAPAVTDEFAQGILDVVGVSIYAAKMIVENCSSSFSDTVLAAIRSAIAVTEEKSNSFADAYVDLLPTRRLAYTDKSDSYVEVSANSVIAGKIDYTDTSYSYAVAYLREIYVGYMRHNKPVLSYADADLDSVSVEYSSSDGESSSFEDAAMASLEGSKLQCEEQSASKEDVELTPLVPLLAGMGEKSSTSSDSSLDLRESIITETDVKIESTPFAEIIAKKTKHGSSIEKSESRSNSDLHARASLCAEIDDKTISFSDARISRVKPKSAAHEECSFAIEDVRLHAPGSKTLEASEVFAYSGVDADFIRVRPVCIESDSEIVSQSDTILANGIPKKALADVMAETIPFADIVKRISLPGIIEAHELSFVDIEIDKREPVCGSAITKGYSKEDVILGRAPIVEMEAVVVACSHSYAFVEFDTEVLEWLDPIRTDNNLYIRQAWESVFESNSLEVN